MSTYPGQSGPYDPNGQDPYASSLNAGQAYHAGQAYPGQPYPDQQMHNPGAQQPYPGQTGYGLPYGGYIPNPTEKNWMGITSLALGIFSVCCWGIPGVIAVIFGILGIQAVNNGEADNKGMSIAGIVIAGASWVLLILLWILGALNSSLSS